MRVKRDFDKKYLKKLADLGKQFAAVRERMQLTRAEMGDKCGVSAVTVGNWEKGIGLTLFSIHVLSKLTKATYGEVLDGPPKAAAAPRTKAA